TAGRRPDRRGERADGEVSGLDLVRKLLEVVVRRVGVQVRREQDKVYAVETDTVDLRGGGEVQHPVQADGRMVGAGFISHKSRPDGVMKFRKCVLSRGG